MNREEFDEKCKKCDLCRKVYASEGYDFWGCYHEPYHGMWVGRVAVCPKEGKVQNKPIDCITRLSNDIQRELYEGAWTEEETT